MGLLGNALWFIFGGFWQGIMWVFAGAMLCLTIVGIPLGLQCFKFVPLAFFPFGKAVVYGGGTLSLLGNIVWVALCGWVLAFVAFANGVLLCITIVGIPFGKQCFKLAKLSIMPFGASVVES